MPMMLPALAAENLTPNSTGFGSFTVTVAGTLLVENRLETVVAAFMVKANVADPVPAALVALNATLDVPAAVGAPEMTPVSAESPAGNPVALKLIGLLLRREQDINPVVVRIEGLGREN